MSVYGGFCTRKQESEYNQCIYKIIYTLSKRCCKDMDGEQVDESKFAACITKLFCALIKLEESKYQPPKFSDALTDIAKKLGLKDQTDKESSIGNNSFLQQSRFNQIERQIPTKYQPKLLIKSQQQEFNDTRRGSKSTEVNNSIILNKQSRLLNAAQPVQVPPKTYNQVIKLNKLPPDDEIGDHIQTSIHPVRNQSKTLEEKEKEFLAQFRSEI
ncbi:hypothetical protein pb186bvf_015987 [Paramecium bursaria]